MSDHRKKAAWFIFGVGLTGLIIGFSAYTGYHLTTHQLIVGGAVLVGLSSIIAEDGSTLNQLFGSDRDE